MGIVDGRTQLEHLVTDNVLAEHRRSFLRKCGGAGGGVQLGEDSAIILGHWALIAELALEHESVRAALRAEGTGSGHARG